MTSRVALDAFRAECDALDGALTDVGQVHWRLPTNCPPWTLHELVVHISWSIRVPDRLPAPVDPVAQASAADYYRRPERDTAAYRSDNVGKTRDAAARVPLGQAAELFAELAERTNATFASHDPAQRLEAGGKILTVDGYLLTRLMSVAAHGVDAAITLGRPAWTTREASAALRPVLLDLLGSPAPAGWTDQDLLEIGTGRRPLPEDDRGLADRFPLLS